MTSLVINGQSPIKATTHVGKFSLSSIDNVFYSQTTIGSSNVITQSILRSYTIDTDILSVNSLDANSGINIIAYPNPISDKVNIKITGVSSNAEVEMLITDVVGRKILIQKGALNAINREINFEEFSSGIYILSMFVDGVSTNTHLIKK